jgi:ferredoxin
MRPAHGKPTSSVRSDTFEIEIEDVGERFQCHAQQSLLRGMERLGKRGIPIGCRSGGCGVCKVRIAAGVCRLEKMSRACVSEQEERQGVVLACRAYPQSPVRITLDTAMHRCVTRASQSVTAATNAARATTCAGDGDDSQQDNQGDKQWL